MGLKRPDPIPHLALGNTRGAQSLKVMLALLRSPLPTGVRHEHHGLAGPGPTSSMSISSGKVWLMFASPTTTCVTVPVTPDTLMVEGYGVAAPEEGIDIPELFWKKKASPAGGGHGGHRS